MNIINLDKEKEIAIKAAKLAGKLLKEDKNILNLKINSNPRDTKLKADIKSEKLILDILNSESNYPVLAEETGKTWMILEIFFGLLIRWMEQQIIIVIFQSVVYQLVL